MSKTTTPTDVMPSAMPSEAEIEAWRALPCDEQLLRLRLELAHPDCHRVTTASMADIREEGRARAAKLRHG